MKKSLITIALVACLGSSLFAVEWGGLFNNTSVVSTSDFKKGNLNQSNGISLWLNSALNEDKSLRVSSEVMYKYNLGIPATSDNFVNIVDLSLLKLTGTWGANGSILGLSAGRFAISDKAGSVFNQNSDGIHLTYSTYDYNVGLYAGYTGLLNRFNVNMVEQNKNGKLKQIYDLAYGYVPLMADFMFTNIGDCSLGIQAEYFIDATGNNKDKAYANLTSKGPIGHIGNYYVAATIGTAQFKNVMLKGTLDFTFPINNFIVSVGGDYASGNNKVFAQFTPITQLPMRSAALGNDAIEPRVTFIYGGNNLVVSLVEKLCMSVPDKLSVNGLDSSLNVLFNVFSDLQIGTAVNAYADFNNKDSNNFNVSLNVNFSF